MTLHLINADLHWQRLFLMQARNFLRLDLLMNVASGGEW